MSEIDKDSSELEVQESPSCNPYYFAVSPKKLLLMSICTFSLYEFYWFYKNWLLVKWRERSSIHPVLRALFTYFFCYSLFKKIGEKAGELGIEKAFPAGSMAIGWIVFTLFQKLPDPYWLITFVSPFFILPIQIKINKINDELTPDYDRNEKYSRLNIVTIVIGGPLFVLMFVPLFLELS